MYNPYIIGENIYLRSPTEEDLNGKWHEWFSDPEVTKYLVDRYLPNSKEKQVDFFNSISSSQDRLVFSVIEKKNNRHIGICNLSAINWAHRYCDQAIIIGEKEFRTGSIAFEVNSLLLQIAFLRLNLRIIKSAVVASNKPSRRMLKVLRFKEFGVVEKMAWIDGRYEDVIYVSLQRDNWLQRNGYAEKKMS